MTRTSIMMKRDDRERASPGLIDAGWQCGGTRAAFTWGVLTEILRATQPGGGDGSTADLKLVAISGTSAGEQSRSTCNSMQKEYLIDLVDAVVVARDAQGKV